MNTLRDLFVCLQLNLTTTEYEIQTFLNQKQKGLAKGSQKEPRQNGPKEQISWTHMYR